MMNNSRRQFGFSLIEALLATGILGIGLVLIATVFPVGVKLTSVATERTIGSIASNEAFSKVRLWGIRDIANWTKYAAADDLSLMCTDYRYVVDVPNMSPPPNYIDAGIPWKEFLYPSMPSSTEEQKYHWSALCRVVNPEEVQVTVFVTRKSATGIQFYRNPDPGETSPTAVQLQQGAWPTPVRVAVSYNVLAPKELLILPPDSTNKNGQWDTPSQTNAVFQFFDNSITIVDDRTGKIYQVQEYKDADNDRLKDTLVLTEAWEPSALKTTGGLIWVVPPAVGSTRNPCVGVAQKTIRID